MHICIPVVDDRGLDSRVCEHFGSSPAYMLVDTETGTCRAVPHNAPREHGACAPVATLFDLGAEAFVVGGIGRGALARIEARGARVFQSGHATVGETLEAFRSGALRPAFRDDACAGHSHGHGHQHGHAHRHEQGVDAPRGGGHGDQ